MGDSVTTFDDGRVAVVNLNASPITVVDLNASPIAVVELQQGPAGATGLNFKTIAVAGQDDVVADLVNDTLTLVAGINALITTNASTDTITISATGITEATQIALDTKVDENTPVAPATATKITYDAKGLVTGSSAATTGDIADSLDKRYVSDAEKTKLVNTTGINSGDDAVNTTANSYADAKVVNAITIGVTTVAPSQNAVFNALELKYDASNPSNFIDASGAISAVVTQTITNGVTNKSPSEDAVFDALAGYSPTSHSHAGYSLTSHNHAGVYEPLKGGDDNYVTDAQLIVIGNTSGINSGDNAVNTTSNTYADNKVADAITNGVTTIAPSQNAVYDALTGKQDAGTYVTGVAATSPVSSSGGTAPTISIPAATNLVDGYATSAHIAAIEANTAKVSNATHTGDATGSTALTVVGINSTNLAGLATGILKNTTGTGVPSIAVASDFPTLNQNTTGNAATVTTNANLTGHITSVGNATTLNSFTLLQLNTAISDANITAIAGDIGGATTAPQVLQVHKISKTLTYNGSGQLTGLSDANGTKAFTYTDGLLTAVTGTGVYQSGTLTYTSGVLTSTTFAG